MVIFLGRLFTFGDRQDVADFLSWGKDYVGLLTMGVIFATPLPGKLWKKIRHTTAADVLLVVLFWIVIFFISTAAQDPFLYFQY